MLEFCKQLLDELLNVIVRVAANPLRQFSFLGRFLSVNRFSNLLGDKLDDCLNVNKFDFFSRNYSSVAQCISQKALTLCLRYKKAEHDVKNDRVT